MNPVVTARQLFKWLRLPWLPEVDAFIAEHSEIDAFGSFGVHRRRGSRIASWIKNATWNDVQHLQRVCDFVLKWYGYLNIHTSNFPFSSGNTSSSLTINDKVVGYQDMNITRTLIHLPAVSIPIICYCNAIFLKMYHVYYEKVTQSSAIINWDIRETWPSQSNLCFAF